MKHFLCLIIITVLSVGCGTESPKSETSEVAEIEFLTHLKEVDWPKAYREQDTVLLDKILAEEFELIDASGNRYTKADELAYIKGHKPSYDSFRFEIKRLEIFNGNMAIISGTGHINGINDEGPYKSIYQSSNVVVKRNGEWKAVSSHVSGIQDVEAGI